MPKKCLQNNNCAALGVGIDMVEVARIEKLTKKNDRFLKRTFTESELEYCLGAKNKYERLAVRFAAKEAGWKAMGIEGIALKDIEVIETQNGRPVLKCADKRSKNLHFHISLSHTKDYGCAVVMVCKNNENS